MLQGHDGAGEGESAAAGAATGEWRRVWGSGRWIRRRDGVEKLVVSLDDDERQVDGLSGQPAGGVLEHGDKVRRDMVGVENGGARLEGGGDDFLERHGLGLIEESQSGYRATQRARLQRRESPLMCLFPGFSSLVMPSFQGVRFW